MTLDTEERRSLAILKKGDPRGVPEILMVAACGITEETLAGLVRAE